MKQCFSSSNKQTEIYKYKEIERFDIQSRILSGHTGSKYQDTPFGITHTPQKQFPELRIKVKKQGFVRNIALTTSEKK